MTRGAPVADIEARRYADTPCAQSSRREERAHLTAGADPKTTPFAPDPLEETMAETVRASHILLMYKGSDRSSNNRSKEEAQTQIQSLKAQVDQGGDFAALASQHSDCPSKNKGG